MKAYLKSKQIVNLSDIDYSGLLSYESIFNYFQDIATIHANMLGVGYKNAIKNNMFWVAVKTVVIINNRPDMSDEIIVETYPSEPNGIRCDRNYNIYNLNNELLISGKTEWTVINFNTKRPTEIRNFYPNDIEYVTDKPKVEDPYSKYPTSLEGFDYAFSYTVKSTDIDLGEHLNNAKYIRIILDNLSIEELNKINIKKIEINYRTPALCDSIIDFYKKESVNCDEYIAINSSKRIVSNIIITKGNK